MVVGLREKLDVTTIFGPASHYLRRPERVVRGYKRENLRPDLIAGITVAVILLPQAIAFAVIAELPPQMGVYSAIMGAIFGALWGSSDQNFTGPTNALSLLVVGSLSGMIPSGTAEFVIAAGLMAVMVGIFQLVMGLARLGMIVNFVSHSVIVGFATGAGILIAIKQVAPLLKLSFPGGNPLETIAGVVTNIAQLHVPTASLGVGTMILVVLLGRFLPRLPGPLISMIAASIVVFVFRLNQSGVDVIGELPQRLPPLADLPLFDLNLIGRLSSGALAVGAIGLVQTTAISRSISAQTGQRLDSNQEFVGQGLANLVSGFFSGYACAASFSVTAVNFKAGARSPLASIFAGIFVLIATLLLAPLAAYLPRAALSGVLIVTAYGMIDRAAIVRIWSGTRGDAVIMVATLTGTLFLPIEFAVLVGILLSLAMYVLRTSVPHVHTVVPDDDFKHFVDAAGRPQCPQMGIIDVHGDLYFGAVTHVEEMIMAHMAANPEERYLVLRMSHVNQCDFSGIYMLENVVKAYRERGGDVYLVRVGRDVRRVMKATDFDTFLGQDHFPGEDEIISTIFHRVLDPAVCIYECPVRVFAECQNLPKRIDLAQIPYTKDIPASSVVQLPPQRLWQLLHNGHETRPPLVLDVREPREYRRGHIPEAQSLPLPRLVADDVQLPADRQIVLVCRGGRRSRRAAHVLQQSGCMNVAVLEGGMLAWEAADLLEAIDEEF